jgi:hypothetical protein
MSWEYPVIRLVFYLILKKSFLLKQLHETGPSLHVGHTGVEAK